MAHVARLRIHPVKALDGVEIETAELTPGGTLTGDREFALFDGDGGVVNGKRTDRIHRLRTDYDPPSKTLTVGTGESASRESFDLESAADRAEDWFGEFFGHSIELRRDGEDGFPDRPESGPSVVSTATIETVASWFDDLTPEGVRRRLRCNVEVDGVPAFWEDRFVGEGAPAFVVHGHDGDVQIEGVEPCGRCVVPTRDPDTGEPTPGFRETFIERRAATFPDWADREAFPHDYTLMLIARIPEAGRNGTLRVGDEITVPDGGE